MVISFDDRAGPLVALFMALHRMSRPSAGQGLAAEALFIASIVDFPVMMALSTKSKYSSTRVGHRVGTISQTVA